MARLALDDFADLADLDRGALDSILAGAEVPYGTGPADDGWAYSDGLVVPAGGTRLELDLAAIANSPGSRAARAYARELLYGPNAEDDLPAGERTERWERGHAPVETVARGAVAAVRCSCGHTYSAAAGGTPRCPRSAATLGSMPERMLQRETRMQLTRRGGGGGRSRRKERPFEPAVTIVPDLPVEGWAPGPQLAIRVTRGTHAYFDRAQMGQALVAVRLHVEQLTAKQSYADRQPPRVKRPRLLVIQGADDATARIAKLNQRDTAHALFEYAFAHAATLVRSLDGLGGC